MTSAFWFLITRSFANRTKARLKRLKQPKYLVGGIIGLLYLYLYFFQFLFMRTRRSEPSSFTPDESLIELLGATVLFLLVASAWIFPHKRTALVFSEAEIAFLFPAPIGRQSLIHFKLLRSQVAIVFTVLLLTLLTGRLFAGGEAWLRMVGWWAILSTLGLHFLGASLTRTLLLDKGVSNALRRTVVLCLLGLLVAGTVWWGRHTLPTPQLENVADWQAWGEYARELLSTPPLSYLLYPFRLMLGPYLANSAGELFRALPFAVGIMALHYLWVIRSNVAFEEASVEVSERLAARIAAAKEGRAMEARPTRKERAPFRLKPLGWAPVAFVWKNLIRIRAGLRLRTLLLMVLPFVVGGVVFAQTGARGGTIVGFAAVLLVMFFVWSLLLGSQLIRCDLRQDISVIDMLKLYPLKGWQIVAGQIATPTLILTAAQWMMLLLAGVLLGAAGGQTAIPMLPVSWLLAAAVLAPFWNALAILIPNAAALWFPGWFQVRPDAPQGIEVTGQRLLLFLGQTLAFAVAVVPAGTAFAVGFLPLVYAGATGFAPIVGAILGSMVLAGESVLGVWLVGKLFDRFDIAAEGT